jgi:hypothetical protein
VALAAQRLTAIQHRPMLTAVINMNTSGQDTKVAGVDGVGGGQRQQDHARRQRWQGPG